MMRSHGTMVMDGWIGMGMTAGNELVQGTYGLSLERIRIIDSGAMLAVVSQLHTIVLIVFPI